MTNTSSESSNSYQMQQPDPTVKPKKEEEDYLVSLNSLKQSHHYLPNEIDDELRASAISLDMTLSIATRSFQQLSSFKCHEEYQDSSIKKPKIKQKQKQSFLLDCSHKNDLENSMLLFRNKSKRRCSKRLL